MEFLAGLYTLLLVTICLLLAVVLWKLNKPRNGGDYEELKRWMQQQLDAQAKDFAARQAAMAEQNYTAIRSVSETLQTSVQSMSTTLAQGQSGQHRHQRQGGGNQGPQRGGVRRCLAAAVLVNGIDENQQAQQHPHEQRGRLARFPQRLHAGEGQKSHEQHHHQRQ